METHLNNTDRDKLVEVIHIGVENAATALSQMTGKKVVMNVPGIIVERVEKIPGFIGNFDEVRTVILLKLFGDAEGAMLFMFPPEAAKNLSLLIGKDRRKNVSNSDALDISALKEVGNVLSGTSMTALSKLLGMQTVQSIPEAATDMLGSVVDSVLAEMGKISDVVLVFKVVLEVEGEAIEGQIVFLFDSKATSRILSAVSKKLTHTEGKSSYD